MFAAGGQAEALKLLTRMKDVITSYSIHYTKLYDPPAKIMPSWPCLSDFAARLRCTMNWLRPQFV